MIVAFYPCIYFSSLSQMNFSITAPMYRNCTVDDKVKKILKRSDDRNEFYKRLIKFCCVCLRKNIRMIFENPWSMQTYLKANFIKAPDLIDKDRSLRGDFFKKETAYWFWNCKPKNGFTYQKDKKVKRVLDAPSSTQTGLCSEERSMISSDYARNWICDFVLGKEQAETVVGGLF